MGYIDEQLDLVQLAAVDSDHRLPDNHTDTDPLHFQPSRSVDLSDTDLKEGQKHTLLALIDEYASVFSQGEGDLGRTGLVQHKIRTGNEPPGKASL